MAAFDSTMEVPAAKMPVKPPEPVKSFSQALTGIASDAVSGESFYFPPKVVIGDSVRVRISKPAYESGLAASRTHLHGRLTLYKGDAPVTTQALKAKLHNLWPQLQNWTMTPLGKGFYELNFSSIKEMRRIRTLGSVNLKPGLMRFYSWTNDFV